MKGIESNTPTPEGFRNLTLAGLGLRCELTEPVQLSNIEDWNLIVSKLESWGQIPETNKINSISPSNSSQMNDHRIKIKI